VQGQEVWAESFMHAVQVASPDAWVLWKCSIWDPAPHEKEQSNPAFRPLSIMAKPSPISATS